MIISNSQLDKFRKLYNPIENQVYNGLMHFFGKNLLIPKDEFLLRARLFIKKQQSNEAIISDEDSFFSLLAAFLYGDNCFVEIPYFIELQKDKGDYSIGEKLQIVIDTFHNLFYKEVVIDDFGSYFKNIYHSSTTSVQEEINFYLHIPPADLPI